MSNNSVNWKGFINFLAYCGMVLIGLVLLLNTIFKEGDVIRALGLIANIIAYVLVTISAFYYAKSKRNFWFLLVWFIALVLIIIFYVIKGY